MYAFAYLLSIRKTVAMGNKRRPRGRPRKAITQDRPFQMRVSVQFLRTLDDWRRRQTDLPSRAEAIRRLVESGTKMKNKPNDDC
jgi:hypothetical protein